MSTQTATDRIQVATGAAVGAGAYVLGYVFTYVLTSGTVRGSDLARITEAVSGEEVVWKIVGWLFYNAHFVGTVVDVDVPFVGGSSTVNFVAESEAISPVLYLVPVLLLVAGGLAVARRHLQSDDIGDAAVTGASVVVGYLPLAIAGAFLFEVTAGNSSAGPDPLLGIVLSGAVFPIVLGAVGGIVAQQTR